MQRPRAPLRALLRALVLVAALAPAAPDCVFNDETVVLTPANVDFLEACAWWRCASDAFTGAGCGETCLNTSAVAPACAANEYVQPCAVPYQPYCRQCRFYDRLVFPGGEGVVGFGSGVEAAVDINGIWTTDVLNGIGTFESAKVQQFGLGLRRAVSAENGDAVVMFADVVFLGASQSVRSASNTWFGRGGIALMFSDITNARGYGALDSRAYMKMEAPSADIYRLLPSPGILWKDSGSTNIVYDYVLSYYWSNMYGVVQQNTITVELFVGGAMPPANTSTPLYSSTHVIATGTEDAAGWRNMRHLFSDLTITGSDFVLRVATDGARDVFIDEIRLFPNLFTAGDMERDREPSNPWVFDTNAWRAAYSAFPVLEAAVGGRFFHGQHFMYAGGSNDTVTPSPGSYFAGSLHSTYHSLNGAWATVRIWVMPVHDPALYPTPCVFRLVIVPDNRPYGAVTDRDNHVVLKQTITRHDWHLFEATFPVQSEEFSLKEYVNVQPLAGPPLAFDNLEVFIEDGVCPFECDTSRNYVRVNGRCERCSTTTACAPHERTVGCNLYYWNSYPLCEACNLTGLGAADEAHGAYVAHAQNECWFECDAGFWFDTTTRACKPCTAPESLFCAVGEYVRACEARSDTACADCATLSESNPAVAYSHAQAARSLVNRSAEEQCLAACVPGFFEWLHTEQPAPAAVADPLCFACSASVCGQTASGLANRGRLGMQYTSPCGTTVDSKCLSCETEVADRTGTTLIGDGRAVGEFCEYKCAAGFRLCEHCRFHAAGEPATNASRLADVFAYDVLATSAWTPAVAAGEQQWLLRAENISSGVSFGDAFRLSGSVQFQHAPPYASRLALCVSVRDDQAAFVLAAPGAADGCLLQLHPLVAPGAAHATANQSFELDVLPFREFQNLTQHITAHDAARNASEDNASVAAVNASRLRIVVELLVSAQGTTAPPAVTLWEFRAQRYEMAADCCVQPYSCSPCSPDLKVAHSHFVPSALRSTSPTLGAASAQDLCPWECDTHYENYAGNGSCLWCRTPSCAPGQFFESCGRCGACTGLPANASWTAAGSVRGDDTSCSFQCDAGFFHASDANGSTVCVPCAQVNCTAGEQYAVACSAQVDAHCLSCSACPLGSLETAPCNATHDRACAPCSQALPVGAFWLPFDTAAVSACAYECLEPLTRNTATGDCFLCRPACAPGNYALDRCGEESNFTGCLPCVLPPGAVATSAGVRYNNTCAWQCPDTDSAETLSYYDSATQACVQVSATADAPSSGDTACNNSDACGDLLGFHTDTATCACLPCTPTRGNSTQPGVSTWEAPGSCTWYCLHPYMRIGEHCYTLEHATARENDGVAVVPSSASPRRSLRRSLADPQAEPGVGVSVVVFVASLLPLLGTVILVSIKIASL